LEVVFFDAATMEKVVLPRFEKDVAGLSKLAYI